MFFFKISPRTWMGVICEAESGYRYLNNKVNEKHPQPRQINPYIPEESRARQPFFIQFKNKTMVIRQCTVLLAQGPGNDDFNVLIYVMVVGIPKLRARP